MTGSTRRRFLAGTSALALTSLAAGCGSGGTDPGTGGSQQGGKSGPINWWDHFSSFQQLNDDWASKESTTLGQQVAHTYYDASKAPQAFQLAKQANKLPDVYSNVIGIPLAALVKDGWVHELAFSDDVMAKIPKNTLTDGLTNLDDKMYGFPMFSFRQSTGLVWYNKDLFTKAGLDPENPPGDYPAFTDACKKLKAAGGAPMTLALGADGGRVRDEVDDMAQTAGFVGYQGLKFTTGEYAYHDDGYVRAIEFFKELYASGYMLPGTNTFSVVNSRTRFASGAAGLYVDGIWCAGGCKALVPSFMSQIGSGVIPSPTAADKHWAYRGRPGASYFVAKSTEFAENATKVVGSFTTDEYQKGMIAAMDQPPLNLDLVAQSDAVDAYKKVVSYCKDNVFLMPQAIVRNPDIAAVDAQRKPVTPHLGNILQGYLGGSIADVGKALKKLSDDNEADREQALKTAKGSGAEVTTDDYVFSDWKPGADYTYKKS